MSYNHYIRVDEHNNIIECFSDAQRQPLENDICINTQGGGQFQFKFNDGSYSSCNPVIANEKDIYLYKYKDGQVVQKESVVLQAEKKANKGKNKNASPLRALEARVAALEIALNKKVK